MRRKEFIGKQYAMNTIVEEYKDFKEFVRVQDSRELIWDKTSRRDRDEGFTGIKKFADAQDMLIHGYSAPVERMIKTVNSIPRGEKVRTVRYADVCGYAPIVPNAIQGLPCSMMNQKKVKVPARVVEIVYDVNTSCVITPDEILNYGCKVVNAVMELERQGYRVKVDAAFTINDDRHRKDSQYILRIPIKNENQPLNIKRMSFAMTHSAFQRFLCFDWAERLPKSHNVFGHGKATAYARETFHENFRKCIGDNAILVYMGIDVDEALADFFKKKEGKR